MRGARQILRRSIAFGLGAATAITVAAVGTGTIERTPVVEAADVATVECGDITTAPTSPALQVASFTGQTPQRFVDTRNGTGGVSEPVGADCVLRIDVDAAGIPDEALALSMSVTALGEEPGFQQVFPCDRGRPSTSNVNNRPDRFPTPNLVIGQPDDDREICVYTKFEADLIVDVSGWWTEEGPQRFAAVGPIRVDDSRLSTGLAPGEGTPRPIDLSGVVPAGTTSIVANLTIVQPAGRGFAVIFPCGTEAPTASNVNFLEGENRAVSVVVGLDAQQRVCTSSNVEHHVVLDVSGYYAPRPQFGPAAELRPEAGSRLVDSRSGVGGWTTPLTAEETRSIDVAGTLPDQSQVTGVIVNVTVVNQEAPGFLTLTRCGADDPETSSLNYVPGTAASNLVTVDLGTTSSICVFSRARTDVVIDLFGVLRAETDEMLAERIDVGSFTWPPYRPDGPDYATECADPLSIDLDLLAGTRARVNGVSVSSGDIEIDLAGPDDLVRLELRRGSVVQRHHFRCVPHDFPRAEVGLFGTPEPGWYLVRLPASDPTPARAVILDEFGAPVWYQDTPTALAVFERAAAGHLLALPIRGQGLGPDPDRGALETRLDGSVIREWVNVDAVDRDNPTDHHDIVELPGGGVTLISYPLIENVDLTALGPDFGADETISDNIIQELDANGDLLWEWTMSDHFAFEPGASPPAFVYTHDEVSFPVRWPGDSGHPGVDDVDPFHINSLDRIDDGSGDYVVSARHIDAIFRIDRATDDVAWILRSDEVTAPPKSGADKVLTIVDDPLGGPRRPHDAVLTGDLLTFLDNRHDTGQATRAVTYRIDADAGTATLVDAITRPDGGTSFGLGSFRPGSGGGPVISWGGPLQPLFQQYDVLGNETMRWTLPDAGNTYRAVWYPKDAFNAIQLRSTSGGTMRIPD